MDMSRLMEMANQLKEKVAEAQRDAGTLRIAGDAGAGMVQVVMNGRHEVIEVHIDRSVLHPAMDPQAIAFLEDLIRAACNAAGERVGMALAQNYAAMAQMAGMDPAMMDALKQPK